MLSAGHMSLVIKDIAADMWLARVLTEPHVKTQQPAAQALHSLCLLVNKHDL